MEASPINGTSFGFVGTDHVFYRHFTIQLNIRLLYSSTQYDNLMNLGTGPTWACGRGIVRDLCSMNPPRCNTILGGHKSRALGLWYAEPFTRYSP